MSTGSHTIIQTADGSYTLHSAEYDENMHSTSGAYEEALLKHVVPSGVLNAQSDNLKVLDVGFGIGYNSLALLTSLKNINYCGTVAIVSLEKDRGLLPCMNAIHFQDEREDVYSLIKKAYRDGSAQAAASSIVIHFGDARDSIRGIRNSQFDAVFFDPHSPSRNPELWTVEFLMGVFRVMSAHGVLTTYSSAPQVRSALIEAGFIIGRGPSVGAKREGTLATKSGVITPLSPDELSALRANVRATPYRDIAGSGGRSEILQRRIDEMKTAREHGLIKGE